MPSDNFDRADSDSLGANWSELFSDLDIVSNHVENPTARGIAEWVGGGDQQSTPVGAQIDAGVGAATRGGVFILKSGAITAVTLRNAKNRGGAVVGVDAHTWDAADWTNGTGVKTKVAEFAVARAGAGTIRIEKAGNTITYKYNGATIGTYTDAGGPTSGASGIIGRAVASTIDNFAVDGPVAPPGAPPITMMDMTAFPKPPTSRAA